MEPREEQHSTENLQTQTKPIRTLMLFSIGPVQEFIAQARKTRDLWFGSYLLSELSKAAATTLSNLPGLSSEIIFPSAGQIKVNPDTASAHKVANVANKVMGIVETSDPKQVAIAVRTAVEKKWNEFAVAAEAKLEGKVNPGLWKKQVKDVLEFYAVWSIWPDVETCEELNFEKMTYDEVRSRTEELMAARKTLKDFRAHDPSRPYGDPKSSLDGGRESVIWPDRYSELSKYGIKNNETLDAISLVKRMSRHTMQKREFKSVCDVAFQQYLQVLTTSDRSSERVQAVLHYIHSLKKSYDDVLHIKSTAIGNLDSRLFYDNRIDEFVTEEAKRILSITEQESISEGTKFRLQQLYDKIGVKPSSYYGFIMCDGDHMGQLLRQMKTYKDHQQFSESLSGFAAEAEVIIQRHEGQLVYSGGDDVMAYLPLHTCLDAVRDIQTAFISAMRAALPEDATYPVPTLSVGMVIVHMLEMLGDVRRYGKAAEEHAKVNRNELALHIKKRSGGDALKVSISFDNDPIALLSKIQRLHREGLFSAGFAFDLRKLHREYQSMLASGWGAGTVYRGQLHKLLRQEAERLAYRKLPGGLTEPQRKSLIERIKSELLPLFDSIQGVDLDAVNQLGNLSEQFIIAMTLVKVGEGLEDHHTN
ncbi:type III-B CRISPR-associated protein Cas10/Cmr2 [Paenibacillus sp. NPDC057934]|uniref:type III-B CRISPR-associated protein Cas10/Cmr2 n=1 Tax=Paenibacillus sp. NPDC057934 TaxID=3346282 RepID=UPI0036DA7492